MKSIEPEDRMGMMTQKEKKRVETEIVKEFDAILKPSYKIEDIIKGQERKIKM